MVCVDIGHHMKVTNCDWVSYMPELKYLIIGDTDLDDITPLTGLTNLVFLELFITDFTDYTPLTTLTGLEDLNIAYTYGDASVITQTRIFCAMPKTVAAVRSDMSAGASSWSTTASCMSWSYRLSS